MKRKRERQNGSVATSPAKMLASELLKLRSELRQTMRVYTARLEIQLAQTVTALETAHATDELSRERVHQLRDLTIMVRKRKVKPEKGRRKDLRKLDALITDVHTLLPDDARE